MAPHSLPTFAHLNWRGLIAPRSLAWSNSVCSRLTADWYLSRSERVWAAAMVVLVHGVAVTLLLLTPSTVSAVARPRLVAFDVAIGAAAKPRPQPARAHHSRVAARFLLTAAQVAQADVVPDVPDSVSIAETTPMALGGGCDLTQPVQDALRHSEDVRRQLPAIPADQRSVANVIVIWNAGWIDPESVLAQPAYATIRQTISQLVAASSADCRNQLQTGPRLIYLPGSAGKTTVLALGSGPWNWQQLIDGAAPLPASTLPQARTALVFPSPPPTGLAKMKQAPDPSPALNALLASLIRKQSPETRPNYP
jgi:hypothetical protein